MSDLGETTPPGRILRVGRRPKIAHETARQVNFPNLWNGWPQGRPHPTRGRPVPWVIGTWGDFSDRRTPLSRLAAKIEKELRQRYQIATDDRILGAVARQAGRQYALSEKLAEDMLAGEIEHQRRTQERWASSVRGFRKAVAFLETAAAKRLQIPMSGTDLLALHPGVRPP